jgi:hypothetical protein
MSNGTPRYMFAGHAIGAAARFHRLDEARDLNHVIPTLAPSVLPVTGGRSEATQASYRYDVTLPRQRCLLAVDRAHTWVEGRGGESRHETELSIDLAGFHVVEKLHIDAIRLHLLSVRTPGADAVVSTQGSQIEGMRLGNVEARITIDEEPLTQTGTADQFAAWHSAKGRHCARHGEYRSASIVRDIRLIGSEVDQQDMSVDGHTIVWKGFGRIILGEIHVKGHERRVTMVRLAMGSDAGGDGAGADGQSNGVLPGG